LFEPRVPGFLHIEPCYPYRFQKSEFGESVGHAAARALEEAIQREGADTVAAFIGEPIHGAGGIIYPTDDYWQQIREICTRYEVLFIADEIITGFGRTGRWFGLEHWGVTADMVTFGKGVTSGYLPLGGMMVKAEIRDSMDAVEPSSRWMHGYTYSGHPTCCVAALKNIEIIEREGLVQHSAKMGDLLLEHLVAELGEHPNVGEFRGGKGLLAAVEFVKDRNTKKNFPIDNWIGAKLQTELRKRGVITRSRPAGGFHPAPGDQVLFAPPLVTTPAEIERMVDALRESVEVVLGT
jgi:adenosylmethionine-8-amino-7-oxononanoate aminotransferase